MTVALLQVRLVQFAASLVFVLGPVSYFAFCYYSCSLTKLAEPGSAEYFE